MSFLPGVNDTAGYEENERGKPIQVPELQNKHLKRCIKSFHFISQWLKLFSLQRKLSSIQIHRISLGIAYLLWVNIGRQAVLVLEAALPKHSGAFGRTPHGAPDRAESRGDSLFNLAALRNP